MTRFQLSFRSLVFTVLTAVAWCGIAAIVTSSPSHAQGQIGFAQKAEDQERKWVDGLSRDDLQGMALMHLVFHPDRVEVKDGIWSDRQQQRIAIVHVDFGKAELDLSQTQATSIDETTKVRALSAELPALKKVKSLKIKFLVQDESGDTDDKKIKCKLDHRLPISAGVVEVYVLEGVERSFWCRDIDPATAE